MALESFTDEQKQEAYEIATAAMAIAIWSAQISEDEDRISAITQIDTALKVAFEQPTGDIG